MGTATKEPMAKSTTKAKSAAKATPKAAAKEGPSKMARDLTTRVMTLLVKEDLVNANKSDEDKKGIKAKLAATIDKGLAKHDATK